MTSPPRLAPLETMTEDELSVGDQVLFPDVFIGMLRREVLAQRLARARAQREAFRAGFLAVLDKTKPTGWSFDGPAAADREQEAWEAWLVALRDREEA